MGNSVFPDLKLGMPLLVLAWPLKRHHLTCVWEVRGCIAVRNYLIPDGNGMDQQINMTAMRRTNKLEKLVHKVRTARLVLTNKREDQFLIDKREEFSVPRHLCVLRFKLVIPVLYRMLLS